MTREGRGILSPLNPGAIPLPDKAIPHATTIGRSDRSEGGILDPELAALVAAWPTLPDHIKTAVRALLGTVACPSCPAPR